MKKIISIIILLLIFLPYSICFAQWKNGTNQNSGWQGNAGWLNGGWNGNTGGGGGGIPSGALQDDSSNYIQDDAGHYLIAG